MSTTDGAASTADDVGSVDPDVAPVAEPLVKSSTGTAGGGGGGGGVEAVSAPNREGIRDPLKHLFSAEILSKHVWNNTNGCVYEYRYMNMYVS